MRSSRVVADFSLMRLSSPVLHREECSCKHSNLLLGTEAVGVKEVSLTIEGGEVQDRQEAAAAACECLSSRDGCYVDDQCHLPGCWTNRKSRPYFWDGTLSNFFSANIQRSWWLHIHAGAHYCWKT